MKDITSLYNPEIKKIVALHDKKGRIEQKLFIVEGARSIETFLSAQWHPVKVFVSRDFYERLPAWLHAVSVTVVSDAVMRKISTSKTPSGVLALFKVPLARTLTSLEPGLVLAEVSDTGNMGTLVRTAAAFAVPSVVVVGGCDPWSPKVVQAAAGAHALLSVIELPWQEVVRLKNDLVLCALVVAGGKAPNEVDLCNTLLVVGSEAHGIPRPWLEECDALVSLPMPGRTESLNAAIAGSIALYLRYEACHQKSC